MATTRYLDNLGVLLGMVWREDWQSTFTGHGDTIAKPHNFDGTISSRGDGGGYAADQEPREGVGSAMRTYKDGICSPFVGVFHELEFGATKPHLKMSGEACSIKCA